MKKIYLGILACLLSVTTWAALETATYISGLVSSNPTGSDHYSTADDHIRLIKSTLLSTFPSITGAVTATHSELNKIDGFTGDAGELNILDGATLSVSELNILDGVTSSATELNILDGVTSSAAELNALDGITSTVTELNYTDGVTSAIQTQLNATATGGGDYKPSVTSRSSTITLAADPDLAETLATGVWAVDCYVSFDGNGLGTQGIQFRFNNTGTMTGDWAYHGAIAAATVSDIIANTASTSATFATISAASGDWLHLFGSFNITASGTFSLQWAQNSSSATATRLNNLSRCQYTLMG